MPAAPTWNLKYKISFTNENNELCIVHLSSKTDNGDLVELQGDQGTVAITWPNSEEDKFSGVRGSEATIKIVIYDSYGVDLDTWLGDDTEWKVDYYKSDLVTTNWQGFLVQDEHTREMQDEPWNLELHAVDGLGLLKDRPLTNTEGDTYTGQNFLLDYAGDILWQVNPYLKLVTHINIFHVAMNDRNVDPENDPWLQIKLEARSWQSDATTFEDCYSVLEKMLVSWGLTCFQWNGAWHIVDLMDFLLGVTSFTTYGYDLDNPTNAHLRIVEGAEVNAVFEAKIAPHADVLWSGPLEPEGEDQFIGLKFANKSVKLTYSYTPWPELPLNNKFERGTLFLPYSGVGYTANLPDDWEHGKISFSGGIPFTLAATTKIAYVLRNFDTFGTEISRELIMEKPNYGNINNTDVLRSEGIPVTAGDKIEVSYQWKTNNNAVGGAGLTPLTMIVYLVNDAGSQVYGLGEDSTTNTHGRWTLGSIPGLFIRYETGEDSSVYRAGGSSSDPIPATGTLYILFVVDDQLAIAPNRYYWQDFHFTYMPYTAGGYRQVKGESHLIAQNAEYKQKSEVEIFLNDSTHGVLKGAMYRFSNVAGWILTEPNWYRPGHAESRRFSEIQALKRFWHTYRAMQKIEGTFSGLIFFGATELPLGLMATLFPEWLGSKRYMITNMEQDHKTATSKITMIEAGSESDSQITIDTNEHKFIFE